MPNSAALLGLASLSIFASTTAVWFIRAMRVDIPDSRWSFLLGWASAGLLGAASFASSGASWLSGIFGSLSLLGSLMMLSLYALGKQKGSNSIKVGDVIPAFESLDDEGQTYSSQTLIGTPTLIKFFRGHW